MQKKSLLVALFCGALCLTGCLKNEESASVVQVRNAKANELNSIATLNEAKAAAELIYANADATLKGAEAELKKAEAALVLAMAETEKVRAELLKTQVALQEVKVEEEGIELLKKAAELEILLAQAEVAQAKAEAQKQYWANKLEQLIADAEVAAVENGLELMKAQDAVEKYILTMEGAKADSAKVYAQKYFKAQNKLVELQAAELAARAARVLIENNAMATREYIYNEIDKKNDSLAVNNEKIKALENYLDVDPETAQAKLEKAWTALNEAYNDYQEKVAAKNAAWVARGTAFDKTAEFTQNWTNFTVDVQSVVPFTFTMPVEVKVGEEVVYVPTTGIWDWEKGEFIPFWNSEKATDTKTVRYPNDEVYAKTNWFENNYTTLTTTLIAPATINSENIEDALDAAADFHEDWAEFMFEGVKTFNDARIESLKKDIADNKAKFALHEKYVKALKDTVETLEAAYLDSLKKKATYKSNMETAWSEFEVYMLTEHPLVSKKYFTERYRAEEELLAAHEDSVEWGGKLKELKETTIPALKGAIAAKHKAYEEAIGNYNKALKVKADVDTTATARALSTARENWNPLFDAEQPYDKFNDDWYNTKKQGTSTVKIDETKAGVKQAALCEAKKAMDAADERLYMLDQLLLRYPEGTAKHKEYADERENATKAAGGWYFDAVANLAKATAEATGDGKQIKGAQKTYEEALAAYNKAIGTDLLAALDTTIYNFNIDDKHFHRVVKYPTTGHPDEPYYVDDTRYNSETGVWSVRVHGKKHVLGSAQVELVEVVNAVEDAIHESEQENRGGVITVYGHLKEAERAYKSALRDFNAKDAALIAQLAEEGVVLDEYADGKAEELYQAYRDWKYKYLAAGDEWATLEKFYNSCYPDEYFDELDFNRLGWRINPEDDVYSNYNAAQFSWLKSKYNVDYNATKLNQKGEEVYIASVITPVLVANPLPLDGAVEPTTAPASTTTTELVKKDDVKPSEAQISNSLKYQIERDQNLVDVVIPEMTAGSKTWWENEVKAYKSRLATIMDKVNAFEAYKVSYTKWVEERQDAEAKFNQAKKDEFDAKIKWQELKAECEAAKAAVDGKVWIYAPDAKNEKGEKIANWDGFIQVSIPDAIKEIEAENAEIEARKHQLELDLKYGKLTYQTVMEVLDETIEVLSADIEIWTAIANQYKAVMNGYLGIVDGEATPVVEEGEDEE